MADLKISALPASTTPLAGTEVVPIVQSSTTKQVTVANLTVGRTVSALSYAITGTNYAAPIGTNTFIGQTAATAHQAGNVGSVGLFINDGGNPSGVFVTNTFDGTYSSQEVEIKTDQGGVSAATTRLKATKTGDIQISTGNIVQGTAAKGINFTANTPAAGMTSQLLNWYEEGTWTPNQGAGLTVVGGLTATGTYTRIGRVVTITAKYVAGTSMTIGAANVLSSNIPFGAAAAFTYTGAISANGITDNGVVVLGGTTLYTALAFTAKTQLFFTLTFNV